MVKTLTKHGNSWALVIDKPILDLLKIQPDTPLEVTTDGKTLTIRAAGNGEACDEAFEQALRQVNDEHGQTLRNLAK